jgi:hypothetical protein
LRDATHTARVGVLEERKKEKKRMQNSCLFVRPQHELETTRFQLDYIATLHALAWDVRRGTAYRAAMVVVVVRSLGGCQH